MKKILAVAIATAFAAPAFAATSNVDIYGRINMAVTWYNDQPSNINDLGIGSYASRIGFKGSEDLGGGLKGIWQIESGVNLDEQNGTLASRNSFLGLAGGWGTVLVGNHDTPLKLVGRKVDLFGDTIGDSRNVMGGGSDTRAKNVAAYLTPNMGGFSGAVAFTTDLNINGTSTLGDSEDGSAYNLSGAYENGPIYVGVAYGDGDYHEWAGLAEHWRVAGSFSFGSFKVVGQYDMLGADGSPAGDYDAWMIGGAYNMGAMTFKANYMMGEYDTSTVEPEQYSLGMDYAMSKRTTLYALWTGGESVVLGKGAGASDQVGPGAGSNDISGLSFGVAHNF